MQKSPRTSIFKKSLFLTGRSIDIYEITLLGSVPSVSLCSQINVPRLAEREQALSDNMLLQRQQEQYVFVNGLESDRHKCVTDELGSKNKR